MSHFRRAYLKNAVRNVAEKFGFSITRLEGATLRQHLRFLLKELRVDCVLDVGAHVGEFWQLCRETGYSGPVISFEPSPESFGRLKQNASGDPRWSGLNIALGVQNTEAILYIHEMSACNSFSRPTPYMSERYGIRNEAAVQAVVPVRRLDSVFAEIDKLAGVPRRVFLKIDTQSHDLAVLDGASGCADRIVAIQSEVSVRGLYEASLPLPDAIREYNARGFEVTGFFPVVTDEDRLRVIEFDCVMVRGQHANVGESRYDR